MIFIFSLYPSQEKALERRRKPSVWKSFFIAFRKEIIIAGIARIFVDISALVGPLLLNGIVTYTMNEGKQDRVSCRQIQMFML